MSPALPFLALAYTLAAALVLTGVVTREALNVACGSMLGIFLTWAVMS